VEDNPADASLFLELLAELQPAPRVSHVSTGPQALDLLARRGPDDPPTAPTLVLLDLKLPGCSGLEILRSIRSTPPLRRLPVVVLSTSAAPRDVDACYEAGANAYLIKSCDPDEMAVSLRAVVRLFCEIAARPTLPTAPEKPPQS
jgi:CheY-like chemotaxis protein